MTAMFRAYCGATSASTPAGRSPATAPFRRGAGSLASVAIAIAAIAASVDSERRAITVSASPGFSPGANPFAAICFMGRGAEGSKIFRAAGAMASRSTGGSTT